jgi:hypothetical protein
MPKKSNNRRCLGCGEGTIRPTRRPGRLMPGDEGETIEIPEGTPIPTCDNCGEEWIDDKTARALDDIVARMTRPS